MERPQYIPHFEVEDSQNPPINVPLEDVSYDELWNTDRVQQHMDNVQHLHGVYWNNVYWHHGQPQRKRS